MKHSKGQEELRIDLHEGLEALVLWLVRYGI